MHVKQKEQSNSLPRKFTCTCVIFLTKRSSHDKKQENIHATNAGISTKKAHETVVQRKQCYVHASNAKHMPDARCAMYQIDP